MSKTICPHCNNTIGFVFGMCCECGWNHLTNKFDKIEVWDNELSPETFDRLAYGRHYDRTKNQFKK